MRVIFKNHGHPQSRHLEEVFISFLQRRLIGVSRQRKPPVLINRRQSPRCMIMEPRIHDDHYRHGWGQAKYALIHERVGPDFAVFERTDRVLLGLVVAIERG